MALLTLLALLLCTAAGSLAGPTEPQSDDLAQSVRDLRADIQVKLALLGKRHPVAHGNVPVPAGRETPDGRLVVRDRAGLHIFRMRNGLAVDAQLGIDRVYRVQEGVLVTRVCVCGGGCTRRFKPAFYGLVAAVGLMAALALILTCLEMRRRRLRRVAAAAAAADRCPLLIGGSSGGRLSIQCDPVLLRDPWVSDLKKVAI